MVETTGLRISFVTKPMSLNKPSSTNLVFVCSRRASDGTITKVFLNFPATTIDRIVSVLPVPVGITIVAAFFSSDFS